MKDGWIGVDFDGTLAMDGDRTFEEELGLPIEPMRQRVARWLAEGREVRIVTARVARKNGEMIRSEQKLMIQEWCLRYLGRVLPVTSEKDYMMAELWDDRAIQVVKNTGERVGDHQR